MLRAVHPVFWHREWADRCMEFLWFRAHSADVRSHYREQICKNYISAKNDRNQFKQWQSYIIFSFKTDDRAATIAMCAGILTSSIPTINCTSQSCRSCRNLAKSSCKVHLSIVGNFKNNNSQCNIIKTAFKCKFWKLVIYLETIHITAPDIIIDRSTEYVHRISYDGNWMKHSTRWKIWT